MSEYLHTADAAAFLGIAPQTLRNKVGRGVFQRGVHFTKPNGSRPRWIKSALEAYLRGEDLQPPSLDAPIPLAGGRAAR